MTIMGKFQKRLAIALIVTSVTIFEDDLALPAGDNYLFQEINKQYLKFCQDQLGTALERCAMAHVQLSV